MFKIMILSMAVCASQGIADDVDGLIIDVDSEGVLQFEGGTRVAVWGLDAASIAQIDDMLIGKWMRCDLLSFAEDLYLGDCFLALGSRRPDTVSEYLHLFTWLPEFDLAQESCSVNEFSGTFNYRLNEGGEVGYGCRSGKPVRGRPQY